MGTLFSNLSVIARSPFEHNTVCSALKRSATCEGVVYPPVLGCCVKKAVRKGPDYLLTSGTFFCAVVCPLSHLVEHEVASCHQTSEEVSNGCSPSIPGACVRHVLVRL